MREVEQQIKKMCKELKYSSEPFAVIIVINWNNSEDTLRCLSSLHQLDYPNYHILLIDNGSTDNSIALLTEATKATSQITLLAAGENLGFSGGVNYGVRKAVKMQADYVLLLNNDTEVAPACLSSLIKAMEANPEVAIAGSKILLARERNTICHAGATFHKISGNPRHLGMGTNDDEPAYSKSRFVDYVTGCSFLVRKRFIDTVDLMDDRFFLYYEESDLCYKLRRQGWKILYVADSKLWHKVGGSSLIYYEKAYYEVRNRLLFTAKNRLWALPFVLCYLIIYLILIPLLLKKVCAAKYAWLGLIDFFLCKFGKLKATRVNNHR